MFWQMFGYRVANGIATVADDISTQMIVGVIKQQIADGIDTMGDGIAIVLFSLLWYYVADITATWVTYFQLVWMAVMLFPGVVCLFVYVLT